MTRAPNAGPGQYMSGVSPSYTNQPFVAPRTEYNVFNDIVNMLPQLTGAISTVAQIDKRIQTNEYLDGEARAKAEAAKTGDVTGLQAFYEENANNRVPSLSNAANTSLAGVYDSVRQDEYRAETNLIRNEMSSIQNRTIEFGDYAGGRDALSRLRDKYSHRSDLQDAMLDLDTSFVRDQQQLEVRAQAQATAAAEAARKQADDIGIQVVKDSVDAFMNNNDLFTQYSALDPVERDTILKRYIGNYYVKVSGTGEDTLGEDGLPTDPMIKTAILTGLRKHSNDLNIKVQNAETQELLLRNTMGIQARLTSEGDDPEVALKTIKLYVDSNPYPKGSPEWERSLDSAVRNLLMDVSDKVQTGELDPVKALVVVHNVTDAARVQGITVGRTPGESREQIESAITGAVVTQVRSFAGRIGSTEGMTSVAALQMETNGTSNLDHILFEQYVDTEHYTAQSWMEFAGGLIPFESLQPKTSTGLQLQSALLRARSKIMSEFDTKSAPKQNAHEIVFLGGTPSVDDVNRAVVPSDMPVDDEGLKTLVNFYGTGYANARTVLQTGTTGDKLKLLTTLSQLDTRYYGAGIPDRIAKSVWSDLGSNDSNTALKGIARFQAYGGLGNPAIRDSLPKELDERARTLAMTVALGKYIDKDGKIISQAGNDWLMNWQRQKYDLLSGNAKTFFTSSDDLGGPFEDVRMPQDLAKSMVMLGNVLSSGEHQPSKSDVQEELMSHLKSRGYAVDEFSNTLMYDPNGYSVTAKDFKESISDMFLQNVMPTEQQGLQKSFGIDENSVVGGGTWWDYFKTSQLLPTDTKFDDYEFRVFYNPDQMALAPVTNQPDSVQALFANGGQIQYRLKPSFLNRTAQSWAETTQEYGIVGNQGAPILGLLALISSSDSDSQWYGAINRKTSEPILFNPRITNLPWKIYQSDRKRRDAEYPHDIPRIIPFQNGY